jgi:hypothetical protein
MMSSLRAQLSFVRAVVIEFVFANLAAERVPMNAQHFCSAALIALRAFERSLDKAFFELPECFFEQDSAFYHLADEPFQLILHDFALRILIF